MAQNVFRFFEELQTALLDCRVTTLNSSFMDSDKGFEWAAIRLRQVQQNSQKVIFIGNGENAAIASHLAIVLCRRLKIQAMTFNDPSLVTCLANDYGFEELFSRAAAMHLEPDDLLIALCSSGKSENIVNAVIEAKKNKNSVISFSGLNPQNQLHQLGDLNFLISSSLPEVVNAAHPVLMNEIVDRFSQLYPEETIKAPKIHETETRPLQTPT